MSDNRPLSFVDRLYVRLTGEPSSERVRVFVSHLGWVSLGFVVAKALTVAVNVLAGRWLGPAEYGRYNLALSVGAFSSPLMFGGLYLSVVRAVSSAAPRDRGRFYGTTLTLAAGMGLLWGAVFWALQGPLCRWLGAPPFLYQEGIAYGAAYGIFLLMTSFLQAESDFRLRAFSEMIFAAVFLTVFLAWGRLNETHVSAVGALIAGYAAGGLYLLTRKSGLFRFGFSRDAAAALISYGAWAMVSALCQSFQMFFLRFVVNRHLSVADVGLLSAYTLSSLFLGFYLAWIFTLVLFPAAAAHPDRAALWRKMQRGGVRLALPMAVFFGLSQAGALWVLGDDYLFRWDLLIPLALTAVAAVGQSVLGGLAASEGARGLRWTVGVNAATALLTVLMGLFLIPRWGLRGAVATYLITYAAGLLLLIPARKILERARPAF